MLGGPRPTLQDVFARRTVETRTLIAALARPRRCLEVALKFLILVGDGMADWPLPAYDNKTTIELARTPAMDRVVAIGATGGFTPIPEGLPAGSDIGNLSLFGYDPHAVFTGRAPLEAANQGITLGASDVAFRCNLVTLENGRMRDFTADHITTEEATELIAYINEKMSDEFSLRFHPGVSYRHLSIVPASDGAALTALTSLQCEPPHNISDQEVAPYLPSGEGAEKICAMLARAQEILPDHPVNAKRIAAGKLPATSIWLWGQGTAPEMETYAEKYGLTGAVVSAVDLVQGIGRCGGLEVLDVPGATGWIDTDYDAKVKAALGALDRHDMVYLHVEAMDEAGHQGSVDLKVQAIEDFDAKVVAPCLAYVEGRQDSRLFVAPDHFTTIETRTHAGGPVPFAVCGAGVTQDSATGYSEKIAAGTGLICDPGHELIASFLDEQVTVPI